MKRLLLTLLLLPPLAFAATVTGTVYDLGLEEVSTAVVSIDTRPEQRIVAKDGTYAFNVPDGSYTLAASARIREDEWHAEENITVAGDGEYVLDLILAPTFSDVEELSLEEADLPSVTLDQNGTMLWIALFVAAALIIIGIGAFYVRMVGKRIPEKEVARLVRDDEYRDAVLAVLERHKGRITQRELRKEVPFSEAKVSLVLTELEADGKIRKIRKGRGNVIVRT